MGIVCSDRSSVDGKHPDINPLQNRVQNNKEQIIKIRKSLIFVKEGSESTFLDLSTPRSGRSIKWRRGDLIGEGAFAKVYQCINLRNGELLAVKNFLVEVI